MTSTGPGGCTVREAAPSDIPQILEVWHEFMLFHADVNPTFTPAQDGRENFAKHAETQIDSDSSLLLVAESDGVIVGYCLAGMAERPPVLVDRGYGMIDDLAVVGEWRRKGIGEVLLRAAEAWFRERGIRRVELQVVTANDVASRFWAKMGYKPYMEKRYREV